MARRDVSFNCDGTGLSAWFYEPEAAGPHACVVMAPGFSSVREHRLDAFAEHFAAAGLAVLLFDYRHFGASEGEPRQLLDIGRQLADWHAAVAYARSLEQVDADRVALWGSSFSGGHVVAVAAGDPRIAAVVSQAPFTDGLSATRAAGPRASLRLTLAGIRDTLAGLRGSEPLYIPAVGAPGTLAAMTAPEAVPGFDSLDPPASNWVNRYSARVMLPLAFYRPYARFAKLRCPILVSVAEADQTTPPGPATRAAERSPNAELHRYPIGHFEIYNPPHFAEVAGAQADFFVRNLLGGAPATA